MNRQYGPFTLVSFANPFFLGASSTISGFVLDLRAFQEVRLLKRLKLAQGRLRTIGARGPMNSDGPFDIIIKENFIINWKNSIKV